jgi:gamma-glutamyltranspeptidase/glutathione hydrolase
MRSLPRLLAAGAALILMPTGTFGAERDYGRSMVITRQGVVATNQPLASQAGAQILARGGSAVDAAIAANAVMGVVEPMSCGIGGDLFAIYWDAKTGTLTGLNASGWAPKGLSIAFLKKQGITSMPQDGIHTVTVPGCVEGWDKLHKRFGRLSWAELFRPAMYYATNGFPVTELTAEAWKANLPKLSLDAAGRAIFLPEGETPHQGQVFRNPALGKALGLVAESGADAFYRGPIRDTILELSDWLGGTLGQADLSDYQAEWVTPISTDYRGWKVYELPPNSQGIATLEMLNIMETFELPKLQPLGVDAFHLKIESQKLAYQDLARYVADPRFAKVPVEGMQSKKYAAERAALVDPAQARCDVAPGNPPPAQGDTIYLTVVDRNGNIVSLIQSLYNGFGSGISVPGFGFHLQNRGALFSLDPEHPNALAPRKRPFHTIIPGFMEKGSLHIGFGIMGGLNQAQAHAQFVSNLVDYGMNIQAALEAPRFTKMTFGGCDVSIESRVPAQTLQGLREKGHKLEVLGAYDTTVGGGHAVLHDSASATNYGASSPRKDGAAVPEPDPYFSAPAPAQKRK